MKTKQKPTRKEKFTKFELVEKVLSEEEKVKDEALELEKSKKFTESKEFEKINDLIEKLVSVIDELPIESRAKMLETSLTYMLVGTKLPIYLKDFILKKVVEDKTRNMDMGQITEFFNKLENLGKKIGLKNNKEYIG